MIHLDTQSLQNCATRNTVCQKSLCLFNHAILNYLICLIEYFDFVSGNNSRDLERYHNLVIDKQLAEQDMSVYQAKLNEAIEECRTQLSTDEERNIQDFKKTRGKASRFQLVLECTMVMFERLQEILPQDKKIATLESKMKVLSKIYRLVFEFAKSNDSNEKIDHLLNFQYVEADHILKSVVDSFNLV